MANANSTIEIELEIKQALDRLNRLERELQKSAQQMQKAADATGKLEGALNKAKTAAAGLFAFFSGQQIVEAADQFTNFANAVRISTSSVAEQTAVQKELYRVAQTTGSSLGDISKLYGRLRQAADQLGSSQAETIKITEIVGKALAASGTSASEASGALLQLAQALNSPRVQAEEFNSLVDAMPNLLRQVERQLGITAGGLKKFVTDGQLSNKLFRDAILGSASAIDDQFGKANDTIATALTRLNNAFILLVGNFEESTGFFNKTAAIISGLAENMDELVRVLKAVAVGFAIAFAPKVIRAIRDTATAMATLGAASKTNVIGALAALGFYIADITGGLDLLTEKLGLTKDASEKTADAIADLTKVSGGGVAAIAPVVPVPSQSYLQGLENLRGYFGNEAATSERILQAMQGYSEHMSQLLSDAATKGTRITDIISGDIISFNRQIEESRHLLQLFTLAYEQALGREAGESVDVLALQFLATQQAMKALLDLRDQELAVIAEVEARIAAINERGIERTESERIILRYQNEMAEVATDERFSLSQKIEIVKALVAARDRELENVEKVLTFQQRITNELLDQLGIVGAIAKNPKAFLEVTAGFAAQGADYLGEIKGGSPQEMAANAILDLLKQLRIFQQVIEISVGTPVKLLNRLLQPLTNAIERLISNIDGLIEAIGQIADNAGGGVQSALDSIGLGQDSYLFGGGFARDLEQFGSDISFGMFGVDNRAKEEQKNQQLFAQSIEALSDLLKEEQDFLALSDRIGMEGMQTVIDEVTEIFTIAYREMAASISDTALRAELLNQATVELNNRIDELAASFVNTATTEFVGNTLTNLSEEYYQLVTNSIAGIDRIRQSALETRLEIQKFDEQMFESGALAELSAEQLDDYNDQLAKLYPMIEAIMEEQIKQFTAASKAQTDAAISEIDRRGVEFTNQQEIEYRYAKEIASVQADANLTIADQVRLVSALEQARQREIDALERSSYLLDLQAAQTGLADILRDFEKTIEGINELVQGLFDQVTELLFSEFNLMPVMEQFDLAASRYSGLLEAAFDPDATEEDITNLQAFVNEYLSAARDVYKSSSTFQNIFKNVLSDLSLLGLQYSLSAPLGAVDVTRSDIQDLAEETGVSMDSLIQELDRLAIAFANQQLEFIGNVLEVDLGYVDVTASIPRLLDLGFIDVTARSPGSVSLGYIGVTASSPSTINLGNITPTFNTDPFTSAITTLNQSIANAINSLISTLQSASSAVSSGGTTTPVTPQTSIIYSLASGASSIAQYNMASMGPADRSSGVMSIGNTTSTGKNYTDAQYAKAFQGSYESLYGTIPADFGYVVILNAKTANSKYFIAHSSLQSAQSYYNSMLSNSYWAPTKYGFRQGGLVPDPMDTIPAMLSPGEYILSPETVRRFGVSSLNQLNNGDSSALAQTNDPDVKRLLAELIQAVRESETEVNVYTDMRGQAKAAVEEFRSELKERTRRQNETYLPVRYI